MDTRERTLARRYHLKQVIGRGGMSTVYRATDDVLGRTVAVKVLLPALADRDPTYAARFEREARAAAALTSSSVVTVYDTGVDEQGGRYIVMEYVSGRSLADMLAEGHPLEMGEAVRIAARVVDGLRAAHGAGILHRDIKPANVMVADDGSVKVLDFGIARRIDGTTLTQASSVVGTAAYMAPERALGQAGDARSDIYSLGCLLYAMLTGGPPFAGEVSAAVLHQQVNADPPPPSHLRREIPAALDALVLAMLAKAPEARPQTAEQVSERLLAASGGRTPGAAGSLSAATAPLEPRGRPDPRAAPRTAATSPVVRPGRLPPAVAAALGDRRWRALVMGLVTALIALLAIALLAGGGSSPNPVSHHTPAHEATHRATTPATHPAPSTTPAQTSPKPQAPKPAGPAAGGAPPGHGGEPPGQAKKHGIGSSGGPGGGSHGRGGGSHGDGGGDGGDGGDGG